MKGNILLINRSEEIGDIIHSWLSKKVNIFTNKKRIHDSEAAFIVVDHNKVIKNMVFEDHRVVIFTTDLYTPIPFPIEKGNITHVKLFPFQKICKGIFSDRSIFNKNFLYCVLEEWLENTSIEDILDIKGTTTIGTGRIGSLMTMKEYFNCDLSEKKDPPYLESESYIIKEYKEPWNKKKVAIFIPTYHRVNKLKKCFESILKIISSKKYTYKIYLGDNGTTFSEKEEGQNMKNFYSDIFVSGKSDVVSFFLSEKNLGKAKMVNHLYHMSKEDGFNPDYIFSVDSDMVHQSSDDNFSGMINVLERCHNIGMVSSNQLGECHHWFGNGVVHKKELNYLLGESVTGVGISGGCVVMRSSDWEKIGGYREDYDIYTGDDAILMNKVENYLKKRVVVSIDNPFFHPPPDEDEKGYREWKMKKFLEKGLDKMKKAPTKLDGENELGKGYYDL